MATRHPPGFRPQAGAPEALRRWRPWKHGGDWSPGSPRRDICRSSRVPATDPAMDSAARKVSPQGREVAVPSGPRVPVQPPDLTPFSPVTCPTKRKCHFQLCKGEPQPCPGKEQARGPPLGLSFPPGFIGHTLGTMRPAVPILLRGQDKGSDREDGGHRAVAHEMKALGLGGRSSEGEGPV